MKYLSNLNFSQNHEIEGSSSSTHETLQISYSNQSSTLKMRSALAVSIMLLAFNPVAKGTVSPSGLTYITLAGANTQTNPYIDDVMLSSMTFSSVTLESSGGQIAAIQSAYVVSGRPNINAEWGDADTGADGNPDPFTRVGINPFNANGSVNIGVQESTDPNIQDIALASVFSSLSLTETTDGENSGGSSVTNYIFANGVIDNDYSITDLLPEIVLFERGNNDTTTVRAITGGTFDAPTLSSGVTITSGQMWNTGINIDTTEISSAQELSAIGIDLNEFSLAAGTIVYGIQIDTNGGDFAGFFQAAEDPETQFSDVLEDLINPAAVVPEPSALSLISGLMALAFCLVRRRDLR